MRAFFLTTSRLGFGRWTLDDLSLAACIWEDPQVMQHHGGPFTRRAVEGRLAAEIIHEQAHGVQYWPVFLKATTVHVGCCGLKAHDVPQGIWEIGCQICRPFWSHGLGREATEAVLGYGFDVLGVRAIRAGHHPANVASRTLITALRFRRTADEFYPATGLMEPCYLLTREEYSGR